MSPDRQRTSITGASKPYSKPASTPASPTPSVDLAQQETPQEPLSDTFQSTSIASKPGFPTYEQYKQIEAAYLQTLTANRREKALISQAMFDRIWAVLHSNDTSAENAQFRFWVRKKFTLGKLKKPAASGDETSTSDSEEPNLKPQTVLLHDKNLVAVQEQIYDILCYGHGISNHGGRDRTCTSVREHYTWIPKELVAQFIRACPTCIAKKCGVKGGDGNTAKTLRQYLHHLGAAVNMGEEDNGRAKKSKSRNPSKLPQEEPIASADSSHCLDRTRNLTAPAEVRTPQSAPMSREVSLYRGLPNGWQFRHDDIEDAADEFILSRNVPHIPTSNAHNPRPRIPSILPVMRTLSEPPPGNNADAECGSSPRPPPLTQTIPNSPCLQDDADHRSRGFDFVVPPSSISSALPRPVVPTSITRAAAPSSIDLQALSSQKTIQAFLALRGSTGLTPGSDSPQSIAPLASPASSDSSALSTLAMVATQSASPANTALPTPVDRLGVREALDKDLAKTGLMMLNMSTEAVYDHGPGVIVL